MRHQIQAARKDEKDINVVSLDLANAFESVPHSLLWAEFHFHSVSEAITSLIKSYFQHVQLYGLQQTSTLQHGNVWKEG